MSSWQQTDPSLPTYRQPWADSVDAHLGSLEESKKYAPFIEPIMGQERSIESRDVVQPEQEVSQVPEHSCISHRQKWMLIVLAVGLILYWKKRQI